MKKEFFLITTFYIILFLCIFCPFVFSYDGDMTYELPVSAAEKGPKRNIKGQDNYASDNSNQNIPFYIQQKPEEIEQPDNIEKYSYEAELSGNEPEIAAQTEYSYSNETEASETDIDTYSDYSENNQPTELTEYDDIHSESQKDTAVETKYDVESDLKEELDSVEYAVNEDVSSLNEEQAHAAESNISSYLSEKEFRALIQGRDPYSHEEEPIDMGDSAEEDTDYIEDEQTVDEKSAHEAEISSLDDTEAETEYSDEADSEYEPLFSNLSDDDDNFSSEEEQTNVIESSDDYISGSKPEEIKPEDFFYNDDTAATDMDAVTVEYEENEPVDAESAYDFIEDEEYLSGSEEDIETDSKDSPSEDHIFNDDDLFWDTEIVTDFDAAIEEEEEEISIIRENITIPLPFDAKEKKEQNIIISEDLLANTDSKKTSVKIKENDKTEKEKTSAYLSFMKSGGGVVKNIHIISKRNGLVAEVIIDGRPSGGIAEHFHVDPPNSGIAVDLYGKWKKKIPDRILFRNSMFSYIDVGLHEDRLRIVFRSIRTSDYVNATVETETLPDMVRIYIVNRTKTNKNPVLQN